MYISTICHLLLGSDRVLDQEMWRVTCDKFWFIDLRFKPKVNSLILNLSPHVIPNQACSLYFILNNILAGFFSTEWKKSVTRDREASQKSSTRLPNIIHTYTFYAASLNDAKPVLTSMKPNTIGSDRSHKRMPCVSYCCGVLSSFLEHDNHCSLYAFTE